MNPTVIYFVIFVLSKSFSGNILQLMNSPRTESKENLNQCVVHFLKTFCTAHFGGIYCTDPIITNFNFKSKDLVKIMTGNNTDDITKLRNQIYFRRTNEKMYFFDLRNSEEFFQDFLRNYGYMNKRGTFIFLIESIEHLEAFEDEQNLIVNLFIEPVYVIDESMRIYIFEPFANGNVSESIFFPEFIGKCENMFNMDLGKFKRKYRSSNPRDNRKILQQLRVRVAELSRRLIPVALVGRMLCTHRSTDKINLQRNNQFVVFLLIINETS